MAEIEGQEPGSPAGVEGTGQELKTDSPAVDTDADAIIKAASELEASAASEGVDTEKEAVAGEEKEPDEKPAPYDQDPKWLAARAAEKSMDAMLEAHGVDNVEELNALLDTGVQLATIMGDRDAKQMIKDADTLKTYREHWDEQERLKEEEGLDPDERAEKYKQELDDFKQGQADKDESVRRVDEAKSAIKGFNDRIESIVDKHDFDEATADMAKMLLGVDNPFNDVDILDPKAVKGMASSGVEKLTKFIATVKQQAIDDYVAGKSEITPISKTDTPDKTVVSKEKRYPDDANEEVVFAAARDELLEKLTGGAGV